MRDPIAIGIVGLGVALPPKVRDNSWWEGKVIARDRHHQRRDILTIERSSTGEHNTPPPEIIAAQEAIGPDDVFRGARRRRVLDDSLDASDLEVEAARAAMADAGVTADEIDLVLVHSIMPDRLMPSNGPAVQDKCGLDRAAAWSLDVGCASTQAHLVTASALIAQGAFHAALIVQSQIGTRLMDPCSSLAPVFGDAASAMVVARVPDGYGLLGHWSRTDGSLRDGVVIAPVVDGCPVREWWTATGGAPTLSSFAPDVGKAAGLRAPDFCREASFGALADAKLSLSDIDLYVGNQSVAWFVESCRRALGLPSSKVVETWAELSNVGDAAIGVNLAAARAAGKLHSGSVVLCYSPAAGFTRSAVVLRWWERN